MFVYTMQPVVQPQLSNRPPVEQIVKPTNNRLFNRLNVCIHDTTSCSTGYQIG